MDNCDANKPIKEEDDDDDDLQLIQKYTYRAIYKRGLPEGLDSLHKLKELCKQRLPYEFSSSSTTTTTSNEQQQQQQRRQPPIITHLPKLFSTSTTNEILKLLKEIENNGWLGINPDSVDGLPSLHLNLISDGKPIINDIDNNDRNNYDTNNNTIKSNDDFQRVIGNLLDLLTPQLYDVLLPEVNRQLNTTSIQISEVFVRRYGQNLLGGVASRQGISAHYDVFSRVTSVIALDNVAAQGQNGLYTTYISPLPSSSSNTCGTTSNHAALRRFFPLDCGDGVVHTFDVLHGVDVQPGFDRTSLIVWFTTSDDEHRNDPTPSWLTNHPELDTNDIVQFVLGSALSSLEENSKDPEQQQQQLYLSSAIQGNSFALTRVGSLFEEGSITSTTIRNKAQSWIEERQRLLPDPIKNIPASSNEGMAMRYWLAGAMMGNPLAQRALADEVMFQASQTGDSDGRLLAAVFFTLAAQQGCQESLDSVSRVIEFDLASRDVQTDEGFKASSVVMTAQAGVQ